MIKKASVYNKWQLSLLLLVILVITVVPQNVLATENEPEFSVHHEFVNCHEQDDLPPAILALTPDTRAGYRDGLLVLPTATDFDVVIVDDSEWIFLGWAAIILQIQAEDVTFIGQWCLIDQPPADEPEDALSEQIYFTFLFRLLAVGNNQRAITGSTFDIYQLSDDGGWDLFESQVTSGANGLVLFDQPLTAAKEYRLIQITTPDGYELSTGHWYLTVNQNGEFDLFNPLATGAVDEFSQTDDGLVLLNRLITSELGAESAAGFLDDAVVVVLLVLLFITGCLLIMRIIRRRMRTKPENEGKSVKSF